MNWLASDPVDRSQTESLVTQAFSRMQAKRWGDAMRLLESATIAAPEDLRPPIVEVLLSIYVARNEHNRLQRVLPWVGQHSAQATKAVLLLARNHMQGVGRTAPGAAPPRNVIESAVQEHLAKKCYDAVDLPVVLTLLVQLRWVDIMLDVANACIDAGAELDEATIAGVLAVLLSQLQRRDALRFLDRIDKATGNASLPVTRWREILNADPTASRHSSVESGDDKVLRFLRKCSHNQKE